MRRLQRLFFWVCWPALWAYFFRSRRSRVIIQRGTEVLLVKGAWRSWFGDERWGLPGGGTKRNEQSSEGAARELFEELGYQIDTKDLITVGVEIVREHGISYRAHFFRFSAPTAAYFAARPPEIVELGWFDLDDAELQIQLKPEVLQACKLLANL